MEDAYIIGIRIALENGVSEGLSAIRQDLSGLDTQIAATTASLQRLTQIAATSSAAAIGDVGRLATRQPGPLEPAAPASEAIPAAATPVRQVEGSQAPAPPVHVHLTSPEPDAKVATAAPNFIVHAPPLATPILPSVVTTPVQPVASPLSNRDLPVRPAIASLLSDRDLSARSPPAILTTATASPPSSSAPAPLAATISTSLSPILAPQSAPSGPSVTPLSPQPDRSPPSAPIIRIEQQRSIATSTEAARPVGAPYVGTIPPPTPNAAPRLHANQPFRHESRPRDWPPFGSGQSAAPTASPSLAIPRAATASYVTTSPALPSVAPQSTQPTSGHTSGDVFLDGTRLGTWMTNHLAREASRPPGGSTGFDPRMGIAWPGTQQGG